MEIMPGVHQIPINYKGRPLNLYLLLAGDESLLMDTGFAETPGKDILPYFQKINFDPKRLTYVLLTHPDLDHVGGVYGMRDAAPQAKFLCGTLDRGEIETPDGLALHRARAHYHWHGVGPDDAHFAEFIQKAGGPGKRLEIASTFDGPGEMELGGKALRVLHLPGHSLGHLGIYLPWENAAIIGDAVHGTANRFIDGRAAFACTYMYVDSYLGTIAQLRAMRLDKLFSCHWPDCRDNASVNAFLDSSSDYAMKADGVILEVVRAAGAAGVTLKDICLRAKGGLGDWSADRDLDSRSMVCGHLQRQAGAGLIRNNEEIPTRYFVEGTWVGLR